jgi:hypothetical protein
MKPAGTGLWICVQTSRAARPIGLRRLALSGKAFELPMPEKLSHGKPPYKPERSGRKFADISRHPF